MFNIPLFTQDIKVPAFVIQQEQKPPEEKVYTVQAGDYLVKIAADNNTTLQRLWAKNTDLVDPDLVEPNKQLKIPLENEELADRPLPAPKPVVVAPVASKAATQTAVKVKVQARGSSSGNTYSYGYCTHYAKQMRPDLPNNLGNANTWYSRAAAQGFSVGYEPRVGAIGEAIGYMHVVYVQSVNGDGTVTVSEQNYEGWGVVSTRTTKSSEFRYIY